MNPPLASEADKKFMNTMQQLLLNRDAILKCPRSVILGTLMYVGYPYSEIRNVYDRLIEELNKRGVKHIYLVATYALFTRGIDKFNEYYKKGMLDGVYTTNLSYVPKEYLKAELSRLEQEKKDQEEEK